ncbi:MAG: HNH endonuclease [Hyphomicrobiaceae bacterium]|nr:HNH endonuclease [Hyphomicrobiaceae bacterium]
MSERLAPKLRKIGEVRSGPEGEVATIVYNRRGVRFASQDGRAKMASKRYKNKTCAYCGKLGASQSGDHVFAREFFLERDRGNLPQVPACVDCNNKKSALETYLLQLMPLGANHPAAHESVRTLMPKRAAHHGNKALLDVLNGPDATVFLIDQSGQRQQRIPVLIDANKLQDWCGLVARGLANFHWGVATPNYSVEVMPLTPEVERHILELASSRKNGGHIEGSIGDGTFEYRGFMCGDGEPASLWMIDLYGRMPIGGDPDFSRACAATWAVFITPAF